MSIAALMIVWGTLVTQRAEHPARPSVAGAWLLCWMGITLALYAFMADALSVVHQGEEAVRAVLPTSFNWWVFLAGLALMAAPVAHITWSARRIAAVNHVSVLR
jgi:hypothetical protein